MQATRQQHEYVFTTTSMKAYLCEYLTSLAEHEVPISRNAKQYNILVLPHGSAIVDYLFCSKHLYPTHEQPIETTEVHIAIPYTSERFTRRGHYYLAHNKQIDFQTYIKNLMYSSLLQYVNRKHHAYKYTEELISQFMVDHKIESVKYDTFRKNFDRFIEKTTHRKRSEPTLKYENFFDKNSVSTQGELSFNFQ